jgi:hypothetical protein
VGCCNVAGIGRLVWYFQISHLRLRLGFLLDVGLHWVESITYYTEV